MGISGEERFPRVFRGFLEIYSLIIHRGEIKHIRNPYNCLLKNVIFSIKTTND